jgi:hypothetical protein
MQLDIQMKVSTAIDMHLLIRLILEVFYEMSVLFDSKADIALTSLCIIEVTAVKNDDWSVVARGRAATALIIPVCESVDLVRRGIVDVGTIVTESRNLCTLGFVIIINL